MSSSLEDVPIEDSIGGWSLHTRTEERVIWTTQSKYAVKIQSPQYTIRARLPPVSVDTSSGQPSLVQQQVLHPGTGDAAEAVEMAEKALRENPFNVPGEIRDLPGVGDRTAEFICHHFEVGDLSGVRRLWRQEKLQLLVQERFHEDLEEALEPPDVEVDLDVDQE